MRASVSLWLRHTTAGVCLGALWVLAWPAGRDGGMGDGQVLKVTNLRSIERVAPTCTDARALVTNLMRVSRFVTSSMSADASYPADPVPLVLRPTCLAVYRVFLRADGETRTPDPFITSCSFAGQLQRFRAVDDVSVQLEQVRIAEFGTRLGTCLRLGFCGLRLLQSPSPRRSGLTARSTSPLLRLAELRPGRDDGSDRTQSVPDDCVALGSRAPSVATDLLSDPLAMAAVPFPG